MSNVVDRLISSLNAHDLDAVMRCYRADAVMVGPVVEAGSPEEIGSYFLHVWQGFPDFGLAVWEKVTCGEIVLAELLVSGRQTGPYLMVGGEMLAPTGRGVSLRCCCFWNVEGDLIVSQRLYYDQLEIYAQLGLRLPSDSEAPG
ncbi:nuclear transport factor 2 family protein [Microtetraspora malaysiensis]|uniref:nuclear transport factor 2 family protein n=1 Tax=Microtetraspora malaysiensis TaxID=161358 RepID=UPI003D94DB86